jgi:N-acetylglutamate synthase-like GNAT family acetyltransferase
MIISVAQILMRELLNLAMLDSVMWGCYAVHMSQKVYIRAAKIDDLDAMSELWYEKVALRVQQQRNLRLDIDARATWVKHHVGMLDDAKTVVCVAQLEDLIIGYAIAVERPLLGVIPNRLGVFTDVVIDPHEYYAGTARSLINDVRERWRERGVTTFAVELYSSSMTDQAFWRALGGVEWMQTFWLT